MPINLRKAVVNAYQSTPTGRLVIHLEDDQGECAELVIPHNDIGRLMYSCIDALQKVSETR